MRPGKFASPESVFVCLCVCSHVIRTWEPQQTRSLSLVLACPLALDLALALNFGSCVHVMTSMTHTPASLRVR